MLLQGGSGPFSWFCWRVFLQDFFFCLFEKHLGRVSNAENVSCLVGIPIRILHSCFDLSVFLLWLH